MKSLLTLSLLLLSACTATNPASPPTTPAPTETVVAPSTPPPPPERTSNAAALELTLTDQAGAPVEFADVIVTAADKYCTTTGTSIQAPHGGGGQYGAVVEGATGPEYEGCLIILVRAGGEQKTLQTRTMFRAGAGAEEEGNRVAIQLELERSPAIDPETGDRMIRLFIESMSDPSTERVRQLSSWSRFGETSLRAALTEAGQYLRGVQRVIPVVITPDEYTVRMIGVENREVRLSVRRESLTTFGGPLFETIPEARRLIALALDLIARNDSAGLAAQFQLAPAVAQEIVARYRRMSIGGEASLRLTSIDERAHRLTFRFDALPGQSSAPPPAIEVSYEGSVVRITSM